MRNSIIIKLRTIKLNKIYRMSRRLFKLRKKSLFVACAFWFGIMVGIHRRVIKSVITGSPMPEAPASHFWVKNNKA